MNRFVHLHVHSEYSVLDGLAPIEPLVHRAKELGQGALALTDHGRLSGIPQFYATCRKDDVKPIIGQEFYLCDDHADRTRHLNLETGKKEGPKTYHMLIHARNKRGYEVLCDMSSIANSPEYFYYRPRIDYDVLEHLSRRDRDSLVVTTTCLNGHVPSLILDKKYGQARDTLLYLRELFPNLYLELQRHDLRHNNPGDVEYGQTLDQVNSRLIRWSDKYGIPFVITNDSHYVTAEQHEIHDLWLAMQTGAKWKDTDRFHFSGYGYHLKKWQEVRALWEPNVWRSSQAAISQLVQSVDIRIPEFENRVWHIPVAPRKNMETVSTADYMRKVCERKLRRLESDGALSTDVQVYWDRLQYELQIIFGAKFEEEFLIVRDYINWARRSGIRVGPGRGSMAGVLAAYLMGIVDVDPIRYDLMFERALNPARPSLPDFDVDFARSRRDEVVQYIIERYNQAPYQARQVGTFARLGPRGTIQRVLRVLGYTAAECAAASKSFPDSAAIVNNKASGELSDLLREDSQHYVVREAMATYTGFYEWCTTMQELVNGEGKHAAGVVISDNTFDLGKLVPTMTVGRGQGRGATAVVTQYDMEALKKLGVVKFDILSLDTLDIIQECIDVIGEDPFEGMTEYEDPKVWRTINMGACAGIFQVEGAASRQVVRDLQLQSFEDLIAVMALGRGGANQFVPAYKEGRDKGVSHLRRTLPDKRLRSILPRGVVLYQEQVMEIGLQIAGMDHHVVDELKEAIKYKKADVWDALKPIFYNGGDYKGGHCQGALNNGCSQEVADAIWTMIFSYRGYGFNRAHATAYAMIAYQTAWLKTYYPQIFYCSLLTHKEARDRPIVIAEAKQYFKIKFKSPDVNRSNAGFTPTGTRTIRYGLTAILGVGPKACEEIILKRPFGSLAEIYEGVDRRRCNKRVIEQLTRIGALETIGVSGETDRAKVELELLGAYVSVHPLDNYREELDRKIKSTTNLNKMSRPYDSDIWVGGLITGVREINTRAGEKMGFVEITYDGVGKYDVVVFPTYWRLYLHSLIRGRVVLVYGKYQHERGSILLERLELPSEQTVAAA